MDKVNYNCANALHKLPTPRGATLVAILSGNIVPEGAAGYGNGVACRVFGIGEDVPVALVYPAELEPLLGGSGAKCLDIRHVENQLGDGLATFAYAAQGVKHDVVPSPTGAFQLDDTITLFPVNSEAEMKCVEFGDDLDVMDVKQNSAKNGRGRICLVLLGHLPGFSEGQLHLPSRESSL